MLKKDDLPDRHPDALVEELYAAENKGKAEPSGSQDMIGLIHPGISRLDYDYAHRGGVFPRYIESDNDPQVASWLECVIHILPVAPRPDGYSPLEAKNLEPEWIARLGQSGKACYDAVVLHRTLNVDLLPLLEYCQAQYPGAMYSGCGGGYLYVASGQPIPGAFHVKVRTRKS
ncbi:MAG: hypothetical protein JSW66_03720 [Phycisphaerales bacterium]|nr:MAG: hypothetical protein JSW66_03720 [Phycisphaerales bacterium]